MAERGDIVQLKRRLGFGDGRSGEHVVIVQATPLNAALPTTIVVPLDDDPAVARTSLGVHVPASEAGTPGDLTAVTWHVRTLLVDRLAPGRVGRLGRRTMHAIDERLRRVLSL